MDDLPVRGLHRATWDFTKRWKLTAAYIGIVSSLVLVLSGVRI